MRSIAHPGTPDSQRLFASPVRTRTLEGFLSSGQTLLRAVTEVAEANGAKSGAFRLNGGGFTSFSYVMPALSKSPDHAVYFSDTYYVDGRVTLETASVTYGQSDGRPWLHCHAVWVEPSGRRHGGHLLPDQVVVAEPIQISGVAMDGAAFTVCPDAETNFSLFLPIASSKAQLPESEAPHAYALRVAPNEDLCTVLEAFCQAHQIQHATILGGVGSTVGAIFQDGRVVEPFVTELLIRSGKIMRDDQGQPCAEIDISIVDYKGGLTEGRLAKGGNPILVTAELVLCPSKAG
ncbi:PCC domain-containing protein [Zwartia sp.]|uniref:PCC domain-containing protein n=1 Tax=Zwartia sp. TaxID=2978004 RepID=UPI003BAF206F